MGPHHEMHSCYFAIHFALMENSKQLLSSQICFALLNIFESQDFMNKQGNMTQKLYNLS